MPHFELKCWTDVGSGRNLPLTIEVGGQTMDPDYDNVDPLMLITYRTPVIHSITPMGTTYGRYEVEIKGTDVGSFSEIVFDGMFLKEKLDVAGHIAALPCPSVAG